MITHGEVWEGISLLFNTTQMAKCIMEAFCLLLKHLALATAGVGFWELDGPMLWVFIGDLFFLLFISSLTQSDDGL